MERPIQKPHSAPEQKGPANVQSVPPISNFKLRTITTFLMLFGFFFVISLGHFYCLLLILFINTLIFREILNLKRNREREKKMNLPLFRVINWLVYNPTTLYRHFFGVTIFYFYPKFFSDKLAPLGYTHPLLGFVMSYHSLLSFILYVIGFMMFVFSLQPGQYKYQFKIFGWTHLILLFTIATSVTFAGNVYNGVIWFLFPALLIITNDTFAYIFGITFGKTPLIGLSPKKTWEGFIGGFFSTIFFSFIFGAMMSRIDYLICPAEEFTILPFTYEHCETPPAFIPITYQLPPIFNYIGLSTISLTKFQLHSLVLVIFASFIAPFGGFFASGFKRAFQIKDFGETIPGHGGVTDRFDCQLLMGVFVYVWSTQVVFPTSLTVDSILKLIMARPVEEQVKIYEKLKSMLH